MGKRIIVVATHPDDETLGAGGTLFRYKKEGSEIYWLIVTNVDKEHGYATDLVARRQKEIDEAAALFQFNGVFKLDLPTTHLDEIPHGKLIGAISDIFTQVKPDHVILPFFADIHSDHRTAFECAYAAAKSFRHPYIKEIWMMETLSETDFSLPGADNTFRPNVFVDITDHITSKEKAFNIFLSEMGQHPFPRSIENLRALAINRGATAGVNYAEGFMNIKTII